MSVKSLQNICLGVCAVNGIPESSDISTILRDAICDVNIDETCMFEVTLKADTPIIRTAQILSYFPVATSDYINDFQAFDHLINLGNPDLPTWTTKVNILLRTFLSCDFRKTWGFVQQCQ